MGIALVAIAALINAPGSAWECSNAGVLEIQCTGGTCSSTSEGAPLRISVAGSQLKICAYSRCSEAEVMGHLSHSGHYLWSGQVRAAEHEPSSPLTLAMDPRDGNATLLWSGFATPLKCSSRPPGA